MRQVFLALTTSLQHKFPMNRMIADLSVHPIGLGCMNYSGGYNPRQSDAECDALLNRALDIGYTLLDTAAVYGAGHSETMIGQFLATRRSEYTLCSKIGFAEGGAGGKRGVDNDPRTIAARCDASLTRLKTDVIDLFYLHRWDKETAVEEVIGAMGRLVEAGKVRHLGMSEVSAETLRAAHAEHPIAAVQSEYSLWTRNPEIAVLEACEALGVTFVAFSPLARQFLCSVLPVDPSFAETDLRANMERFAGKDYAANLGLLAGYKEIATRENCSPAQLALAWMLAKHPKMITIPGTKSLAHLEENIEAAQVTLSPETVAELDDVINERTVHGPRYNERMQAQVDTEDFV